MPEGIHPVMLHQVVDAIAVPSEVGDAVALIEFRGFTASISICPARKPLEDTGEWAATTLTPLIWNCTVIPPMQLDDRQRGA